MNSCEIHVGNGWYDLEYDSVNDEYFRWNTSVSFILIGQELSDVEFTFRKTPLSPNQRMVIEYNSVDKITIDLKNGDNIVRFQSLLSGKIKITTDSFAPKYIVVGSTDTRNLGVQLIQVKYKTDQTVKLLKSDDIILEKSDNQIKKLTVDCEADIINKNDYGMVYIRFKDGYPDGKINLGTQLVFSAHRSGWMYVVKLLSVFHNRRGVMLDGFIEDTFLWKPRMGYPSHPYKSDWVGFMHQPVGKFSDYIHDGCFVESLNTCKGIFTFSNNNRKLISSFFKDLPVESLYHPTKPCMVNFSMENFLANKNKKLVQTGNHLRNLSTLYKIKSPYRKIHLTPGNRQDFSLKTELESIPITKEESNSVRMFERIDDRYYDRLLSENIAFLHLHDCCASNFLVECMTRGTPILINPLPSVVEYLGSEYPFYFNSVEEAENKLNDSDLIEFTHKYMVNSDLLDKVSPERFIHDFRTSRVYQNL